MLFRMIYFDYCFNPDSKKKLIKLKIVLLSAHKMMTDFRIFCNNFSYFCNFPLIAQCDTRQTYLKRWSTRRSPPQTSRQKIIKCLEIN
ncbi:hypothetical protein BpHYR1_006498 [Brachionus plicatilis]|uniref:Uncharacterized protein n=1 Tax=Brachionus plicatilis TaxID=10195 RepID=A0A3M7SMH8_BRAPC|nr:hypothetical protein BpHYR1_006498 [Brachionus plicatilis]